MRRVWLLQSRPQIGWVLSPNHSSSQRDTLQSTL
jgi:hypothetical protein